MRKKIITFKTTPKVTVEPFFDILNTYFKDLLNGKHPEHTQDIQEAITIWKALDCETDCDECLFSKRQSWIESLNTNAWDLCDVISKMFEAKLKVNRGMDLMDVPGLIVPGSAYSRK